MIPQVEQSQSVLCLACKVKPQLEGRVQCARHLKWKFEILHHIVHMGQVCHDMANIYRLSRGYHNMPEAPEKIIIHSHEIQEPTTNL